MESENKVCPLCKQKKSNAIVNTCLSAYRYVIKRIKADHPEWAKKDGACPKCIEYYKNLGK